MIHFSDLHLKPESEAVCFQVLDAVFALAIGTPERAVAFNGDFFHVRYALPVHLLNKVVDTFTTWTRSGLSVFIIPGNHDQYTVGGRHALEVFGQIPGVRVFHEPVHDPNTGTWLPYRKDPQQLVDWLKANPLPKTALPVAHLHHGIVGAFMNNGARAGVVDGLLPSALEMFQTVYCGHWHRHQVVGQCVYVGSQWQTRADEAGQQKGVLHSTPVGHRPTGPSWKFIPLDVGRRFHQLDVLGPEVLKSVRQGDVVRVPAGSSGKLVEAIQAMGVDVYAAPQIKEQAQRLQVGAHATLREQAVKYVELQCKENPELDPALLLAAFDGLTSQA